MIKVRGDAEMVSFVSKEQGDSCGGIRGIVIGELGDRKQIQPIVLLVVAIYSEVLFQGLFHSFGLSVALGVITRGKCFGTLEKTVV